MLTGEAASLAAMDLAKQPAATLAKQLNQPSQTTKLALHFTQRTQVPATTLVRRLRSLIQLP